MWLPGRLVYCAANKGPLVPGLLKCLGAQPLPSAAGLEHLGEQAWPGHLAEECIFLNSLLFGAGLASLSRPSAEGCVVPSCPPIAACTPLSRVVFGEGALLSPLKEPTHRCQALLPALLEAGRLPHHSFVEHK